MKNKITFIAIWSDSSLAALEEALSASNLPLKHSTVLKPSSSSIVFSLNIKNQHHIYLMATLISYLIQKHKKRTRTHLHFDVKESLAIIVSCFFFCETFIVKNPMNFCTKYLENLKQNKLLLDARFFNVLYIGMF